jgi:hypothetical protein
MACDRQSRNYQVKSATCLSSLSARRRREPLIGQRERTIAVRATDSGLIAHTLDEQRDINDAGSIFGDAAEVKIDPEMVELARQHIDRQTTTYDPSDLEDRYETRLRQMIDAKLRGEGIDLTEPAAPSQIAFRKKIEAEGLPLLGVHVLFGQEFLQLQLNTLLALEGGRIRPVQIVAHKPTEGRVLIEGGW